MSTALARIESSSIVVQSLGDMERIGKLFAASKMFADVQSEAQAVVKIMAGGELGLTPFAAMSELHVINGKVSLSAGLLAKKVKASGRYDYRVVETTDKTCSIDFFEQGQRIGNSTFTIEQAKKAGVKNLDKWPQNMLFARAISNGVRFYCPDVTGQVGVYTDGELDDVQPATVTPLRKAEPQGEVIEAEVHEGGLDESYVKQIVSLYKECGWSNIDNVLKRKGVDRIELLSEQDADEVIKWLNQKRDALKAVAEQPVEAEVVHEGANTELVPNVRVNSGLDRWKCSEETGTRALAMNVLSVWAEAGEKIPLTNEQLYEELGNEFPGMKSRKELTAAQANQFIAHLRAYIEAATRKAAK